MKKTVKLTFSAMMSALAVVLMLVSYFPYFTYAVPAVAGLFVMITVIEVDIKYAWFCYISSAFIVFLTAEPESKLTYVCLFGFYPIIKVYLDKIRFKPLSYLLKLAVFNLAVFLIYKVFVVLLGISIDDMGGFGKYSAYILLAVGNAAFILYDIAVGRMALFYLYKFSPVVRKYFKF